MQTGTQDGRKSGRRANMDACLHAFMIVHACVCMHALTACVCACVRARSVCGRAPVRLCAFARWCVRACAGVECAGVRVDEGACGWM